jgi:hypothetical protein
LVLVILAVIWAAVLVPPYLQNRSESRPADSISTFRNQLSVLERRASMVQPSPDVRRVGASPMAVNRIPSAQRARLARMEAKKRRRDILVTLLAAAGLTLAIGLVLPQVLLLHLVIDALLAAYVALLVRQRKVAEERAMKVRYLSTARRPVPVTASPQLALRRSAGG